MGRIDALLIDIETYSSVDLAKCGVYKYAESPDFRLLLFGYMVNGKGPIHVVNTDRMDAIPTDVLLALLDPECLKWAYNSAFERVCLSRYLQDICLLKEGVLLSPAGWDDIMVRIAALGYPHSLAAAGEALGLEEQKLKEGKDLIRFFCKPAPPSLLHPFSDRNTEFADPERWRRFVEYNRRDVKVEAEILNFACNSSGYDGTPRFSQYELDQEINDRGIRVDSDLVNAAIWLDRHASSELTEELSRLTALSNPNSVSQIRAWLEEHGQAVKSLGKKQVAELLKDAPEEIREVLLLRQQLAKSSVKKYQAMRNYACADGRVRGMFQFYGASRSGRWAGRGVQLQNLPQNHLPDLDQARQLVLAADYDSLKLLYDSVPDVLSELIRTAFVPAKGKKFIVADFSAIEARVIAWLAGEAWRTEVFASGGDIYCASASQMFHVPVEKHGVNGHLRQKGKIAELALGYGGGVGALKAMGALEMGVPEEELQPLVNAWRSANPKICQLWWDVDAAVKSVLKTGIQQHVGPLTFKYTEKLLLIALPSGRYLSYVNPRLGQNKFGGESIQYDGLNAAKKWDVIESYGPKFVENIVQGIARDLLAEAMIRLDNSEERVGGKNLKEKHYDIVAHVHDEVIIEADPEDSVEEVCRIMGECPAWAQGLILRADGYECEYYRKD